MEDILKNIYSHFDTQGEYLSGESYGSGHIHDTYRIITRVKASPDYILQKLNTTVFHDIPNLQNNIEKVTGHLRRKLMTIPGADPLRECVTLIPTRTGGTYFTDANGDHWRMLIYIPDHRNYDVVDTEEKAFEGGKAIGRFTAMLADLPGNSVAETIPDFHNIEQRVENLKNSISTNPVNRAAIAETETAELLKRAGEMTVILKLGREGKIPLRITHNDTKFNNILLDRNDKALCVIDLDTVMPGYIHYDFGDAIRTAANTAEEDAIDLSAVRISLRLFEAWTRGFLSETKDILTPVEKEWLAFAPRLITYAQAVRFLTDYIDGDTYYKTKHAEHNLQRTRAQLALLKSMEANAVEMKEIVQRYC